MMDERIAKLEVLVENLATLVEAHMAREEQERKEIMEKINTLENKLSKYGSFIGGIVFVISALWGVFIVLKDFLIKH